jgi:hypothetical protein
MLAWIYTDLPDPNPCASMKIVAGSLEADLEYAAVDPDQPTGFWTGEGHGPEASYSRQRKPGGSLVRSPRGSSGIRRDYDGAARLVLADAAVAFPAHIAQAKNGSCHRRIVG